MVNSRIQAAGAFITSCTMMAILFASAATARIVGRDDRIALPSSLEAEFSGVGRLVCRDPVSGESFASTATLVGDRETILAAGHFGRAESRGRAITIAVDYCAFELRSSDGKRTFGSLVQPQPVTRFSASATPDPRTPDWAILKLQTPAPGSAIPAIVQPISARDLARQQGIFMVSYHSSPAASARIKLYSPQCRPSPLPGAPLVFRHSCDTAPGSSGGLLYLITRAGPRAVGINHGSSSGDGWNYGQVISQDLVHNLPRSSFHSTD